VDEAARANGFHTTPVYHGGDGGVLDFSQGNVRGSAGIGYFTESKNTAWRYAIAGGQAPGYSLADLRRRQREELPERTPTVQAFYLTGMYANPTWETIAGAISGDRLLTVVRDWAPEMYDKALMDYEVQYGSGDGFEAYWKAHAADMIELSDIDMLETMAGDDTGAMAHEPELTFLVSTGLLNEYAEATGENLLAYLDNETDEWTHVVLSPSQVKSADPVTRRDDGTVIPLSERFQPESDDIRFARGETSASRLAALQERISAVPPKADGSVDMEARQRVLDEWARANPEKEAEIARNAGMVFVYHGGTWKPGQEARVPFYVTNDRDFASQFGGDVADVREAYVDVSKMADAVDLERAVQSVGDVNVNPNFPEP